MTMTATRVCSLTELAEGEVREVSTDPPVAVYLIDGEVYATSNVCSHGQSLLSDGYVDGDRIECAWHFGQFCIRTGRALAAPATEPIATYKVDVVGNDVYVDMPEPAS
jgi:nitrite reductase/ring-hydroxylating ferredoxin subunit